MKKKGIIFGGIIVAIIIVIIASAAVSQIENETLNLDMGRTHGTVTTAMGSPVLGSESAPITIIEFGDYQCHQCFNWFHNTKDSSILIDHSKILTKTQTPDGEARNPPLPHRQVLLSQQDSLPPEESVAC